MPGWPSGPTSLSTSAPRSDPASGLVADLEPIAIGRLPEVARPLRFFTHSTSVAASRYPIAQAGYCLVTDALLRFRPVIGTSFETRFSARREE
jgi:hypothetical protein